MTNRIKLLREELGYSQLKVADAIDTSVRMISFYEIGERTFSLKVAIQLADLFCCSLDYLMMRSDVRIGEFQLSFNMEYIDILIDCEKSNIPPDNLRRVVKFVKTLTEENFG